MMQRLNVFDYGTYRYSLYCCTKTLHEEFQHAALGPATHEQPDKRLLANRTIRTKLTLGLQICAEANQSGELTAGRLLFCLPPSGLCAPYI